MIRKKILHTLFFVFVLLFLGAWSKPKLEETKFASIPVNFKNKSVCFIQGEDDFPTTKLIEKLSYYVNADKNISVVNPKFSKQFYQKYQKTIEQEIKNAELPGMNNEMQDMLMSLPCDYLIFIWFPVEEITVTTGFSKRILHKKSYTTAYVLIYNRATVKKCIFGTLPIVPLKKIDQTTADDNFLTKFLLRFSKFREDLIDRAAYDLANYFFSAYYY